MIEMGRDIFKMKGDDHEWKSWVCRQANIEIEVKCVMYMYQLSTMNILIMYHKHELTIKMIF